MKIYFPEYKDAFGKIDGAFSLEVLSKAPFPEDLVTLGSEGIRQIWHDAKLRGRGYNRADEILKYAKESVGLKDGGSEQPSSEVVCQTNYRFRYRAFRFGKQTKSEMHGNTTCRKDS